MRDRLASAQRFAGRREELAEFEAALRSTLPPFAVLHVHGPGGIGKTTLLREFARSALLVERRVVQLDARHLEATTAGLLRAVHNALDPSTAIIHRTEEAQLVALAAHERLVLFIDTYESLMALDSWVRGTLLPSLAHDAMVVLAGRMPPSAGWMTDGAWRALLRVLPLRNLTPDDCEDYLAARGFTPERREALRSITHGHPLALSLFADVVQQGGHDDWTPDRSPHVVRALLERFIQDVPSPHHRLALQASAVARTMTESLLRTVLPDADCHALFEWLRERSFIEESAFGLHPHDLVRDLLDHDLRWRDPQTSQLLHDRLRTALVPQVRSGEYMERVRAMNDLTFLHRFNPVLGSYFAWQQLGSCTAEGVRLVDVDDLFAYIRRVSGEKSLPLARHWFTVQPEAWYVVRDTSGRVAAALMYLAVQVTTEEDRMVDPTILQAYTHAQELAARQQAPLGPADEITVARFYIDPPRASEPSSATNAAQLAAGVKWISSPRLAWSFCDVEHPQHWHGMLSYYDFHRVGDVESGLYGHDWRHTPVEKWLEKIGAREIATELHVAELESEARLPLLALSHADFAAAVRDALRSYHRLDRLATNTLMQSRLVRDQLSGVGTPAVLRQLLKDGVAALADRPRTRKSARALEATFLRPGTTQEAAAERLGLPFTTYRYQLSRGLDHLVDWLWERELQG